MSGGWGGTQLQARPADCGGLPSPQSALAAALPWGGSLITCRDPTPLISPLARGGGPKTQGKASNSSSLSHFLGMRASCPLTHLPSSPFETVDSLGSVSSLHETKRGAYLQGSRPNHSPLPCPGLPGEHWGAHGSLQLGPPGESLQLSLAGRGSPAPGSRTLTVAFSLVPPPPGQHHPPTHRWPLQLWIQAWVTVKGSGAGELGAGLSHSRERGLGSRPGLDETPRWVLAQSNLQGGDPRCPAATWCDLLLAGTACRHLACTCGLPPRASRPRVCLSSRSLHGPLCCLLLLPTAAVRRRQTPASRLQLPHGHRDRLWQGPELGPANRPSPTTCCPLPLVTVSPLGLCCSLRHVLGPSEPEARFLKLAAPLNPKQTFPSFSPTPGRSWS